MLVGQVITLLLPQGGPLLFLSFLILAQNLLNHNFLCVSLSFVHNIRQATAGGTDGVACDGRSCLRLPGQEHPCLQVLKIADQIFAPQILAGQVFPGQDRCHQIFSGLSHPGFDVFVGRDDVCFFISQSGETADTLGALR